jgi:hypothetical protein
MDDILSGLIGAAAGAIPCLFMVAVAALIGVAIYWNYVKTKQRREACARLAAEYGFQFYAEDTQDIPGRYGALSLFNAGHGRRAENVLAGDLDGRPVVLCDYRYKTGSGKDETTHRYQAALFEMPILAPRLVVRRESVLDRIAEWVGHGDLNFESEEFSRRFHVKCDEPKFAYDILHQRLIEYLLGCGNVPYIEMQGVILLLYFDGTGDVAVFRRLLEIGQHILAGIPDYVVTERGTARAQRGQASA